MTTGRLHDNQSNPQNLSQLEFFDLQNTEWKKLPNAATLPHQALLVVAERSLYAVVGSDRDHPNQKGFFQYDAKQNRWNQLPSMTGSYHRSTIQVVYLDGFIYLFGAQIRDFVMSNQPRNVERYDLTEQCWEGVPSLPSRYRWTSVITYEGSILVYDMSTDNSSSHVIHKYDPRANTWEIVLLHHVPARQGLRFPAIMSPVLFEYQDQVYRLFVYKKQSPVVNKINTQPSQNDGRWSIGEEVNQDLVAGNEIGAFSIQDQIFVVNRHGVKQYVQLTDLKMTHGKAHDAALAKRWHDFVTHISNPSCNSNVTKFTFDKKKFGWIPSCHEESR